MHNKLEHICIHEARFEIGLETFDLEIAALYCTIITVLSRDVTLMNIYARGREGLLLLLNK